MCGWAPSSSCCARGTATALAALTDYALARHWPGREGPLGLLDAVVEGQAGLIAQWMAVGFIHGVMNTDNMSVSAETIDYGPCAFMEAYDPGTVYSSIDHHGRYAYGNQPAIAQWNLARLAQTLLPLIDADEGRAVEKAQAAVDRFAEVYEAAWEAGSAPSWGWSEAREGDRALILGLLEAMQAAGADFTTTFRRWRTGPGGARGVPRAAAFDAGPRRGAARLAEEGRTEADRRAAMRAANPAVIPRNHMVEEALAAAEQGDFAPFETLLTVIGRPFDDHPDHPRHLAPARPEEAVTATFCGT
jgi:serine/tyrosine/threonine adenylyltransferase